MFSRCFNRSNNKQETLSLHQAFDSAKENAPDGHSFTVNLYCGPGQSGLVKTFIEEKVKQGWKADLILDGYMWTCKPNESKQPATLLCWIRVRMTPQLTK